MHAFETPAPIRLRVEIPNGRIRVTAAETGQTRIVLTAVRGDAAARAWIAEAEVGPAGDEIVVRGPRVRLVDWHCGPIEALIEAPLESAAVLSTGAGDIDSAGRLGSVTANAGSGDVRLGPCSVARVRTGSGDLSIAESSGSVDARTGSGDIRIGQVAGDARIATGNGDASLVAATGAASLTTGSGDIEVAEVGASLEAFSASGDVSVGRAQGGRVRARSVSGDVSVGVAAGVAALLDVSTLSGDLSSDLGAAEAPKDGERRVELVLSTVSGDVRLLRV